MAAPEGYNALGKIGISYKGDYDSNTTYERLDAVEHNGSTYLAIKDAPDGAPRDDKVNWIYLAKGFSGDIGDSEITFTEAENRENINTGESVKTVFGKIKKFFADLTAPAFAQMITTKEDLLATKATGYVPDAKAVADAYTELNGKLKTENYTITLPSGATTDFVICKRSGNVVYLSFRMSGVNIPYGTPLATVPVEIRPNYNTIMCNQYFVIDNEEFRGGQLVLTNQGNIMQEQKQGILTATVINISYIL